MGDGLPWGIGGWIGLPLLGLCVVVAGIFALPGIDCEGSDPGMTLGRGIFLVAGWGACAAIAGAALYRLWTMYRGNWLRREDGLLLALFGFVLLLVFTGDVVEGRDNHLAPQVWLGILFALGNLGYLLYAWAQGRTANETGAAIPVFLIGVVVFAYLPLIGFSWGVNHGGLC